MENCTKYFYVILCLFILSHICSVLLPEHLLHSTGVAYYYVRH